MNLQQFVAESLVQIVNGVREAQTQLKGSGARVAPLMRNTTAKDSIGSAEGDGGQPVFLVEFDVLVAAAEGTGTKGGIGVVVGVLGLGSQGQSESKTGQDSRIQFKVPLLLPAQSRDGNVGA